VRITQLYVTVSKQENKEAEIIINLPPVSEVLSIFSF
jgi:hypothetical protein